MPKRSSKLPRDLNQLAAHIVAMSTGQESPVPKDDQDDDFEELSHKIGDAMQQPAKEKNPAAVALGRLGGMKGGKARAASLSATERSNIAKTAASARWKDKD